MATEYKLSYTASDINSKLGQIDNLAKKSEVPTKVSELTNDSGYLTEHQSLEGLATESYVDNAISADVIGQINVHNSSTLAHNDIRILIEQITTNKVSVSDIIDNLTTNVSNKPLSAAQGVALKTLKQDKITGTAGQFVVIGDDGAQPIDADVARTFMGAMKAKANIFTITASTTLDLTHTESLLRVNSSNAVTITIPLNSSVAFAIGSCITITKIGTGDVTIDPSAGVTLNSKDSARTIDGQFSAVTLYKVATDEWDMWGALA